VARPGIGLARRGGMGFEQPFRDRLDAAKQLADRLGALRGRRDLVVLGLPRGGVPVARVVADALGAPFDVYLVRKLGVPGREELAMGALASGGARVLDRTLIERLGIGTDAVEAVTAAERRELERRERLYRGGRPAPSLAGKTVLLIDDGLATGSTMRAAIASAREHEPTEVIVGVPVAPAEACEDLTAVADEVVCLRTPVPFEAVGLWYQDFAAVSDDDVRALLDDRTVTPS
jgi:putative phosphoribosyl transferase